MIEFFLSKFWAVVCGIIILGAAMASIDGLETATNERSTERIFESIVTDISSFAELDGNTTVIVSPNGLLDMPGSSIEIMWGGIMFKHGSKAISANIPESIIPMNSLGQEIDQRGFLVVYKGQCMILQKNTDEGSCILTVQDEKVSTTFLTESMNVSQSRSSL